MEGRTDADGAGLRKSGAAEENTNEREAAAEAKATIREGPPARHLDRTNSR